MSVEIPTDDPQAKNSANDHLQNDPPPYVDEDTYPLTALPTALPASQQPDQYYPVPSRPSQVSQHPATNATVQRVNRITVIETRPNNYIEFSIFNVFCCYCCFCFGMIALYHSLQVDKEFSAGRIQEAIAASQNAKTYNYIAFGLGTVTVLLIVGFFIAVEVIVGTTSDDDYNS